MGNKFDTSNAPITEPAEIIKGDYTSWKRTDLGSDYPNSLYTLKYRARSEGNPSSEIEINAIADGDDYLVELSSATTAAAGYVVGIWHWSAYITRNSDSARITVDEGLFTIELNKDLDTADPRSLPRKMLAYIEAALLHRAENYQLDIIAYQMGVETSATRKPENLLQYREYWKRELKLEIQKERARKGQSTGRAIKLRF